MSIALQRKVMDLEERLKNVEERLAALERMKQSESPPRVGTAKPWLTAKDVEEHGKTNR